MTLTQKGKQHGKHKRYHGYPLRTIDRCKRAGSFQADARKSSEVTRLHPQSDGHLQKFLAACYSKEQVIELLLGIALKTISNYLDHISPTPLDNDLAGDERI